MTRNTDSRRHSGIALDRRRLVQGMAATLAALAGCVGGDSGDSDGGAESDNPDDSEDSSDSDDSDDSDDSSDSGDLTAEEAQVDSYLTDNDANGYDGTDSLVDATGQAELTIEVGPGGDRRFDPVAVRISRGTTVTWEWLSDGHSVEQTASEFEFRSTRVRNEGTTHQHTFEDTGVFRYRCLPHAAQGHHGAIIVEQ
jgi:halocyanin-like protein